MGILVVMVSSSSDNSSSEDETTVAVRILSKVMNEDVIQEKVTVVQKDSRQEFRLEILPVVEL